MHLYSFLKFEAFTKTPEILTFFPHKALTKSSTIYQRVGLVRPGRKKDGQRVLNWFRNGQSTLVQRHSPQENCVGRGGAYPRRASKRVFRPITGKDAPMHRCTALGPHRCAYYSESDDRRCVQRRLKTWAESWRGPTWDSGEKKGQAWPDPTKLLMIASWEAIYTIHTGQEMIYKTTEHCIRASGTPRFLCGCVRVWLERDWVNCHDVYIVNYGIVDGKVWGGRWKRYSEELGNRLSDFKLLICKEICFEKHTSC